MSSKLFSDGNWLILLLFAYLVVVAVYVAGIATGWIDLSRPIFKNKEGKKALRKEMRRLKEKYGAGFQFYPFPAMINDLRHGSGWHVQLDTTILSTTALEGAKADLIKLNFDFYREEGGAQSWFK